MAKNTTNKTRKDYQVERFTRIHRTVNEEADDEIYPDPEAAAERMAEELLEKEDEMIWAFHRDPRTDLTQMEARDRAQGDEYPERVNLSQSSVSRKLSKLDRDMLVEPIAHLRMEERDHPEELAAFMGPMEYDDRKKLGFTDFLDTYRAVLARFLVDVKALQCFAYGEEVTPEWARERFPELDPDLGRRYYLQTGMTKEEVHPPTEEIEREADAPAPADD